MSAFRELSPANWTAGEIAASGIKLRSVVRDGEKVADVTSQKKLGPTNKIRIHGAKLKDP